MIRYIIKNCGYTWIVDLQSQTLMFMENRSLVDRLRKKSNKKVIALQDIEEIEVLWNDIPMGLYGQLGHGIIFKIKSKYLDIFTFCAFYGHAGHGRDKEEFLQVVKVLEESGVRIVDHYGLLKALADPNIHLAAYIDNIVKERGK